MEAEIGMGSVIPFCVEMTVANSRISTDKATLLLTINFFEEELKILLGKIRVGIRSGRLCLAADKCRMPLHERNVFANFETKLLKKRKSSRGTKYSMTSDLIAGGGVSATNTSVAPTVSFTAKTSDKHEKAGSIEDEFKFFDFQISGGGTENQPFWDFSSKTSTGKLLGAMKDARLGTVEILDTPSSINATFIASHRNLVITGSQGVWPSDMNASNRAVRRLAIVMWLRHRIEPCLAHNMVEIQS